jgi:hypothetical protein
MLRTSSAFSRDAKVVCDYTSAVGWTSRPLGRRASSTANVSQVGAVRKPQLCNCSRHGIGAAGTYLSEAWHL